MGHHSSPLTFDFSFSQLKNYFSFTALWLNDFLFSNLNSLQDIHLPLNTIPVE